MLRSLMQKVFANEGHAARPMANVDFPNGIRFVNTMTQRKTTLWLRRSGSVISSLRHGLRLGIVLLLLAGCGSIERPVLPAESTDPIDTTRYQLLVRFAHISDVHITDEESPGRLTAFADLSSSAWRPQEAYSTQILDGTIRAINQQHVANGPIHFTIHTGDGADNNQFNEWRWLVDVFDGREINPLSGPDDRAVDSKPPPELDPHYPFRAQWLYRNGVHGPLPSIPWYNVIGNHDHFAMGIFPIQANLLGGRSAPMPPRGRIGLFYAAELVPEGEWGWGVITPAHPGPPPDLNFPTRVVANPDRRFATEADIRAVHANSISKPSGHGIGGANSSDSWFSTSPAPGVRLIVLNSSTPQFVEPTFIYSEGAISEEQLPFLRSELEKANTANEKVIVATHHPAASLELVYGSSILESEFVELLNRYSCVVMHLAGHWHRHMVFDRSGYVELITGSILDAPQQGRIVEIWQGESDIQIRYRFFSHLDESMMPVDEAHAGLVEDPLRELRRDGARRAGVIE